MASIFFCLRSNLFFDRLFFSLSISFKSTVYLFDILLFVRACVSVCQTSSFVIYGNWKSHSIVCIDSTDQPQIFLLCRQKSLSVIFRLVFNFFFFHTTYLLLNGSRKNYKKKNKSLEGVMMILSLNKESEFWSTSHQSICYVITLFSCFNCDWNDFNQSDCIEIDRLLALKSVKILYFPFFQIHIFNIHKNK